MVLARDQDDGLPITAAPEDERRYLPALLVAFGVANLSAYGRDAAIAAVFGASAGTDAYFVGAFLPTLLATILVLESTVPALVPAFSRVASDGAATRTLLRVSVGAAIVVLSITLGVVWLETVPLVRLLAHGFGPGQVALAASLLRITAWSLLPLGLGAIIGALLNVHHRYLTPPLGLAVMNVTTIVTTIALSGRLGIYAPAWGMLVGSCLYLLLQIWTVMRLELRVSSRRLEVPLAAVGTAMVPTLIFSLVVQNVAIVERWLASMLPAGRISYLAYAGKLMMSPLLVITAAGGLLAFVAMSHASSIGNEPAFRSSLARSARLLTLLLAMATLILIFLRSSIVVLALQRGQFTARDTAITATLLSIYALGLIPNGLAWLLYRSLQSRGSYWEAVRVALISAGAYISCAAVLFHFWELDGIAAAFPISQTISCILLAVRQSIQLTWQEGARFAGTMMLMSAGLGAALFGLQTAIGFLPLDQTAGAAITLLAGVAVVIAGLSLATWLLPESEGELIRGWLSAAAGAPARWRAIGRS